MENIKRILFVLLLNLSCWNVASAYGPYLVYLGENISFQVIDENNQNLENVLVEVCVDTDMAQSFVSASGAFVFLPPEVGTFSCRVSKTGYSTETFTVECMEPVGRTVNNSAIKIRLIRQVEDTSLLSSPSFLIEDLLAVASVGHEEELMYQTRERQLLLFKVDLKAVLPRNQKYVA